MDEASPRERTCSRYPYICDELEVVGLHIPTACKRPRQSGGKSTPFRNTVLLRNGNSHTVTDGRRLDGAGLGGRHQERKQCGKGN